MEAKPYEVEITGGQWFGYWIDISHGPFHLGLFQALTRRSAEARAHRVIERDKREIQRRRNKQTFMVPSK